MSVVRKTYQQCKNNQPQNRERSIFAKLNKKRQAEKSQKNNSMEISGRIIKINPVVTGDGRNGQWKKQEFILETVSQYPKKVCFTLWGDKIDKTEMREGMNAVVSFDLESKEYNGRWFTEARAWMVKGDENRGAESMPANEPRAFTPSNLDAIDEMESLPF
jgi:hypothetical protein